MGYSLHQSGYVKSNALSLPPPYTRKGGGATEYWCPAYAPQNGGGPSPHRRSQVSMEMTLGLILTLFCRFLHDRTQMEEDFDVGTSGRCPALPGMWVEPWGINKRLAQRSIKAWLESKR